MDEPTLPIRDLKQALHVVGGSEKLANEIFAKLQKELPQQLLLMREQFVASNLNALWDTTHKMHGSAAFCGTPALKEATCQLEYAIKDSTSGEINFHLERVELEVGRILQM